MLRERKTEEQMGYEMVLLEELVPEDHLLRKVKAAVDFSFIHELCKDLYGMDNGRPAVPPEMLFKILLLGYLYGIPWLYPKICVNEQVSAKKEVKRGGEQFI